MIKRIGINNKLCKGCNNPYVRSPMGLRREYCRRCERLKIKKYKSIYDKKRREKTILKMPEKIKVLNIN